MVMLPISTINTQLIASDPPHGPLGGVGWVGKQNRCALAHPTSVSKSLNMYMVDFGPASITVKSGVDAGFLDRAFKFTMGFDLLILPDYLLFFQIFLKILHENEIILS